MVAGGRANCTGSTVPLTQVLGECTLGIDELSEASPQTIAVQTSDPAPFATVTYELTVKEGRARITFVEALGEEVAAEATPGSPATGSVRVQLDPLSRITFDLEPVGGPASGVEYKVSFVCDCMP
jgi:hypothetical protein